MASKNAQTSSPSQTLTQQEAKKIYASWNRSASVAGYGGVWELMENLDTGDCVVFHLGVIGENVDQLGEPELVTVKLKGQYLQQVPDCVAGLNAIGQLAFKEYKQVMRKEWDRFQQEQANLKMAAPPSSEKPRRHKRQKAQVTAS
jgi:hypothetical protein